MAVAVRGGQVGGVMLHTDQGSEYTAGMFRAACAPLGSANRWADRDRPWTTRSSNRGTPPWSSSCARRTIPDRGQARRRVAAWVDEYNRARRHSSNGMISPIDYELAAPNDATLAS